MNYRVYVKKKEAFRVEADSLFHELKQNLNLSDVHGIELYNVYDVFHGDDHDMELLKDKVLSEKVTDEVFESSQSVVFDEAENRLTAMRGLLVYFLNQAEKKADEEEKAKAKADLEVFLKKAL